MTASQSGQCLGGMDYSMVLYVDQESLRENETSAHSQGLSAAGHSAFELFPQPEQQGLPTEKRGAPWPGWYGGLSLPKGWYGGCLPPEDCCGLQHTAL
jgi:hypothetical protein